MRAKRVFGKAKQSASKTLTLSDSPENARDLEWFLSRYEPYEVVSPTLLRERAQVHLDKETLVQKFLSNPQPLRSYDMAVPPREYQKTAAELFLTTGALLLADSLGSGKTVSAIAALCDGRTLPALVVTMTSLPTQWEEQLKKFLPGLKSVILKKGTPYDLTKEVAKKYGEPAFPDVIITNYHKLNGWATP
jgi:SNF2 family DNA or RNA helicase